MQKRARCAAIYQSYKEWPFDKTATGGIIHLISRYAKCYIIRISMNQAAEKEQRAVHGVCSGDTNYTMLNYETQNTSPQELTYWASCQLEDSMYLTQSLSLTLSGSSCAPDSNKTLTTSS